MKKLRHILWLLSWRRFYHLYVSSVPDSEDRRRSIRNSFIDITFAGTIWSWLQRFLVYFVGDYLIATYLPGVTDGGGMYWVLLVVGYLVVNLILAVLGEIYSFENYVVIPLILHSQFEILWKTFPTWFYISKSNRLGGWIWRAASLIGAGVIVYYYPYEVLWIYNYLGLSMELWMFNVLAAIAGHLVLNVAFAFSWLTHGLEVHVEKIFVSK